MNVTRIAAVAAALSVITAIPALAGGGKPAPTIQPIVVPGAHAYAFGLNDNGQVLAYTDTATYRWQYGKAAQIDGLPTNSTVIAQDNHGNLAGEILSTGPDQPSAFVYNDLTGPVKVGGGNAITTLAAISPTANTAVGSAFTVGYGAKLASSRLQPSTSALTAKHVLIARVVRNLPDPKAIRQPSAEPIPLGGPAETSQVFTFKAGKKTAIPELKSSWSPYPTDINDAGQIAGNFFYGDGDQAFFYNAGSVTNISNMKGTLDRTYVGQMNSKGQVIGITSSNDEQTVIGFVFSSLKGIVPLPTAIQGHVKANGGGSHVSTYPYPEHINDAGIIVGEIASFDGDNYLGSTIVAWLPGATSATDLGQYFPKGSYSWASGFNNKNQLLAHSETYYVSQDVLISNLPLAP